MRRAIGAVAAALMMAGAGGACAAPERLVMQPYPGPSWQRIADETRQGVWKHVAIPSGQTADDFTEILSDQGFPGLAGADPAEFLKQRFAQDSLACEGVRVDGPRPREEGAVRVAYGQLYCARQRGEDHGAHIFFKVISGDAALYEVSLDVRTPASDEAGVLSFPPGQEDEMRALLKIEADAGAYIDKSVYLCGGRSTDPRCGK